MWPPRVVRATVRGSESEEGHRQADRRFWVSMVCAMREGT